jgi:hypothetical protein
MSVDAAVTHQIFLTAHAQAGFVVAAGIIVSVVGALAADQRGQEPANRKRWRGTLQVVLLLIAMCGAIGALSGAATSSDSGILAAFVFGDTVLVIVGGLAYLFHATLNEVLYAQIVANGRRVLLPLILCGLIVAVVVLWQRDTATAPADSGVTSGVFRVSGATADGLPEGIHEHVAPSMSARMVPGLVHREGSALAVSCQVKTEQVTRKRMPRSASRIWDRLADGNYVSDPYMDTSGIGTFDPGVTRCH